MICWKTNASAVRHPWVFDNPDWQTLPWAILKRKQLNHVVLNRMWRSSQWNETSNMLLCFQPHDAKLARSPPMHRPHGPPPPSFQSHPSSQHLYSVPSSAVQWPSGRCFSWSVPDFGERLRGIRRFVQVSPTSVIGPFDETGRSVSKHFPIEICSCVKSTRQEATPWCLTFCVLNNAHFNDQLWTFDDMEISKWRWTFWVECNENVYFSLRLLVDLDAMHQIRSRR